MNVIIINDHLFLIGTVNARRTEGDLKSRPATIRGVDVIIILAKNAPNIHVTLRRLAIKQKNNISPECPTCPLYPKCPKCPLCPKCFEQKEYKTPDENGSYTSNLSFLNNIFPKSLECQKCEKCQECQECQECQKCPECQECQKCPECKIPNNCDISENAGFMCNLTTFWTMIILFIVVIILIFIIIIIW